MLSTLRWLSEGSGPQTISIPIGSQDVNQDHVVDILDLILVADHLGENGEGIPSDVNGDSVVNILDLILVGKHFGESLK